MKTKIILLFLAMLLPLSVFTLNADEKEPRREIPLNPIKQTHENNRSLTQHPIECCYMGMMNLIQTTFSTNLGNVTLEVINTNTGEISFDTFNSAATTQAFIPLSGAPGFYTITYTTQSGDIYEGTLTL